MPEARLADAVARLDRHRELDLPPNKRDLLGRLVTRFLWPRHLKGQVQANLATRDAIVSLREIVASLPTESHPPAVHPDELRREVEELRAADRNMMAGLNQRLYAEIGAVRSELSDLRLALAERSEDAFLVDKRLDALEDGLQELAATARETRVRHAQLDLLLDEVRASLPDRPAPEALAALPAQADALELAVVELLDGPAERVRENRAAHLDKVGEGPVFDVAPGRGEWLEVLRARSIPASGASTNPAVVRRCAQAGLDVEHADPLSALAAASPRALAAVTAFRFVERLAPDQLARFVALAATALRPGGALVVETAESDADFHLDPFAVRPVHETYLRFLVSAQGLTDVAVVASAGRYTLTARR